MDLRSALRAAGATDVVFPASTVLSEDDTLSEAIKKVLLKNPQGLTAEAIAEQMINERYDYRAVTAMLQTRVSEGLVQRKVLPGPLLRFSYEWTAKATSVTKFENNMEEVMASTMYEQLMDELREKHATKKFDINEVIDLMKSNFAIELQRMKKAAGTLARSYVTKGINSGLIRTTGKGDKARFYFEAPKVSQAQSVVETTAKEETSSFVVPETLATGTAPEIEVKQPVAPDITEHLANDVPLRSRVWSVVAREGQILRSDLKQALETYGTPAAVMKAIANAVAVGYVSVVRDDTDPGADIFSVGEKTPAIFTRESKAAKAEVGETLVEEPKATPLKVEKVATKPVEVIAAKPVAGNVTATVSYRNESITFTGDAKDVAETIKYLLT